MWENFLVSERKKYLLNIEDEIKSYFWRTTQQQKIDYIEEQAGKFTAYEFKWNPGTRKKFPQTFLRSYPVIQSSIITPDNFEQFLI